MYVPNDCAMHGAAQAQVGECVVELVWWLEVLRLGSAVRCSHVKSAM